MDEATFKRKISEARKRNRDRDGWERSGGAMAPVDVDYATQVRTVMAAIECGMRMNDWEPVAEAFCLAQDIDQSMRTDPLWERINLLDAPRTVRGRSY